jgi:hypothetical protein
LTELSESDIWRIENAVTAFTKSARSIIGGEVKSAARNFAALFANFPSGIRDEGLIAIKRIAIKMKCPFHCEIGAFEINGASFSR